MARKRDVYVAIMVASANGRGLRLTAAECDELTLDDAIETRASNALTQSEHQMIWPRQCVRGDGWKAIDPYAEREPFNGSA